MIPFALFRVELVKIMARHFGFGSKQLKEKVNQCLILMVIIGFTPTV
jgi:hypothetical protein